MCLNRPPLLAGEVAATQSWPEGGVSLHRSQSLFQRKIL